MQPFKPLHDQDREATKRALSSKPHKRDGEGNRLGNFSHYAHHVLTYQLGELRLLGIVNSNSKGF
jgi:hypothetical protein